MFISRLTATQMKYVLRRTGPLLAIIKHMFNWRIWVNEIRWGKDFEKRVFREIFRQKGWGDSPSVSGTGSDEEQTREVARRLPGVLKEIKARSLVDAPCGDYYWMKKVKLDVDYTGVDIVSELIEANQKKYGRSGVRFIEGNIIREVLPKGDVILCRDCLVHFPYKDIFKTVNNFKKSGAKYLLTTNFAEREKNSNIHTGQWRPINLEAAPFNFPKAMMVINEKCSEEGGIYKDKSLGLWKLDEIKGYN